MKRTRIVVAACLAAIGSPGAWSGAAPAGTCAPFVPCADPRGCPDLEIEPALLSQDLTLARERFSERSCAVLEGEVAAGERILLRFTYSAKNMGPGDLVIGNPADHPEWFDFETCHGHPHFKEYADYRLWTPAGYEQWKALRERDRRSCARDLLEAHPEIASQMVAGRKQGFCVVDDLLRLGGEPLCPFPPDPGKYGPCEDTRKLAAFMGLSVCWSDQYDWSLDGQWIDVTDLPDGDYVLEAEANAERFFEEADYSDNSAALQVTIVKPRKRR